MERTLLVALISLSIATGVAAEAIPGTSVSLTPPEGFATTDRFAGFMMATTNSSIVVNELPAPFAEAVSGFEDPALLAQRRMTVLDASTVTVDGHDATLFHLEQPGPDTLFRKWILVVDRDGSTVLIVASYPAAKVADQEAALRESLLGATFAPGADPLSALAFTVTPVAPFEIAQVIGQGIILAPGGQFPAKDESVPALIVALSPTEGMPTPADERRELAEAFLVQSEKHDFESIVSEPIEIGGLPGYRTTARGPTKKAGLAITVRQTMLFDEDGFVIISGRTPSAEEQTYLPLMDDIAASFAMKAPTSAADGSDR